MSPAEFGRAIKICGAAIGLLAVLHGVGVYSGYIILLFLLALITYLGFPYVRAELVRKSDIFAGNNVLKSSHSRAHVTSRASQETADLAQYQLHNGYISRPIGTSTPTNDPSSFYKHSEEMNRHRSFCFKDQSGTAPVSVLSPINGPVTRFGNTHGVNKVQRRHSFNVSGRPLSFLNASSPANTPGSTVKIKPKIRTSTLFSPRLFEENGDHNESRREEAPAPSLPKVHRLQEKEEDKMRSFNSSTAQEIPRATQQSKYSLLGLLPRINLGRLSKPFMTDKNSSMNKVTVKIAPPEALTQSGPRKGRVKRSEKEEEKVDDILSILREKRKRTMKEEEKTKSPVESQAIKRRKQTETLETEVKDIITEQVKYIDLSPENRPRLKRRAIHDSSSEGEGLMTSQKRPKKANVCRINSRCNEFTASLSSSRKLRASVSRTCSQASSRRSSLSTASTLNMDHTMEQATLKPDLPAQRKLVQETDHDTSSASIDIPSITSTPASSVTGTLDEKLSSRGTPVKKLFTASPAFGANLAVNKDSESLKPQMYTLKKESTMKRRQGSILVNSPEDFSKLPKERYPVSHEDMERDRQTAHDRVQKMLIKGAQQSAVSDKEKLQESLFGKSLPETTSSITTSASGTVTSSDVTDNSTVITSTSGAALLAKPVTETVSTAEEPVKPAPVVTTQSAATAEKTSTAGGISLPNATVAEGFSLPVSTVGGGFSLAASDKPSTVVAPNAVSSNPLLSGGIKAASATLTSKTTEVKPPVGIAAAFGQAVATLGQLSSSNTTLGQLSSSNTTLGQLSSSNTTLGQLSASNTTLGQLSASNTTLGQLSASNTTLGQLSASNTPMLNALTKEMKFSTGSLAPSSASLALSQSIAKTTNITSATVTAPSLSSNESKPGGFSFGLQTAPATTENKPATQSSTAGFSFGMKTEKTPAKQSLFGNTMATSNIVTNTTLSSLLPSGQIAATTTAGGFSFGNQQPTGQTTSAPSIGTNFGGFSTGSKPTSTTVAFGSSSVASVSAPSAFGQTSQTGSVFGQPATTSTAPAFNFGQTTKNVSSAPTFGGNKQSATPSIFGQNSTPAVPVSSVFGKTSTQAVTTSSVFNQNAPGTSQFSFGQNTATTQSGGFSFGQQTAAPQPSVFGAKTATTNAVTGFGGASAAQAAFGQQKTATTTASTTGFGFGAPSTKSSSVFGASATSQPVQGASTGFNFGTGQQQSQNTGGFPFGANTKETKPTPSIFGATATSTAAPTFGQSQPGGVFASAVQTTGPTSSMFGAPKTQSSTPVFGQSTNQTAAPSAFGQPATNKGFDFSKSGNNSFQFGGTSNTSQPAASSGGFNFMSSSTPAAPAPAFGTAAPAAPFGSPAPPAFGSPAPSAPPPAFGSPAAPGFGSPAPSNPAGGMFNIGSTGSKNRTTVKARRRGGRR